MQVLLPPPLRLKHRIKHLSSRGPYLSSRKAVNSASVMDLCLVVSCIWFLCPLVSFQCLLCSSLWACLSPSVCQSLLLCASPPHYLTWPPPSILSSPVPRVIISLCVFSLCFPSCPCPFIASVGTMFSQSSFCLQSPSGICFLDCEFWFFPCLIWTLLFELYFAFFFHYVGLGLLLCFLVFGLIFFGASWVL